MLLCHAWKDLVCSQTALGISRLRNIRTNPIGSLVAGVWSVELMTAATIY